MREILFRGKRKDYNRWIEGYLYRLSEKLNPFIMIKNKGGMAFEVIPETVGQYTGMTDKNGKKIFEGDVVLYVDEEGYYPEEQCEFVGRIVFENGVFGIGTNDTMPLELDFCCECDTFVSLWELYWNLEAEGEMLRMIEVIGNIHNNPELLKEGGEV